MAKSFQSKDQKTATSSRKSVAAHLQTKMKVGQPGDRYEREADQAAAKVVSPPTSKKDPHSAKPVVGKISKLGSDFGQKQNATPPEKEPLQKQEEEEESLQAKTQEKKPLQKQEEEEESLQAKTQEKKPLQKQEEEEESLQAKTQEKKPLQKQEEEEESLQAKTQEKKPLQKQEEEEESLQAKTQEKEPLQKQEEEEESLQAKTQEKKPLQKQEEEEESLQAKTQEKKSLQKQEEVQSKTDPRANVRDKQQYPVLHSIEPLLLASKGKGDPLSEALRLEMQARFGADFSKVRIHTGFYAVAMASKMKAQAFTNGSDIYFNAGKYDPESPFGKILLAHELTHVIQQNEAEQKLSEARIAESNALRNDPLPSPVDKAADQAKAQTEKEKKEQAEKEAEKKDQQQTKAGVTKPKKKKSKGKRKTPKKKKEEEAKAKTPVGQYLKKVTEKVVRKKEARLRKLARNQKKKDDAKTKLQQSQKAVVPPSLETQSRANASQVQTVDQAEAPKPEEKKVKEEFNQAMENAVPASLEAMDKFKEEGKGRVVGEKVRGVVTTDTQAVQQTYQEIENTPEPAPAETPEAMPPTEVAPPTGPLDLGEGVVGEVRPEDTDMSEFDKKTDKVMEEEGLSDEQLEMVDSGPLAEAKADRKKLKTKVETGPKEVRQLETDKKKEIGQEMKKEEVQGKKRMKEKRRKELLNTKDKQKKTKKTIEEKRQAVTEHINTIYKTTNDKVKKKLEELEKQSLRAFDDGQAAATKTFEDNVKRRLEAFKDDRYSGLFGWARWLKDKLLGMEDLPQVKRIFDTEKSTFISTIDSLIAKITADNKKVIQDCKTMVQQAREKIADYVAKLGPALQSVGQQAQSDMQAKLDALDQTVNKKEEELKEKLAEKREAAIKAIEEKIESMKEELSGLAGKLAALLLAALIKFFEWAIEKIGGSSDKIMKVVNKSKTVIKKIVKAPGKFLSNLGKAVKQGFSLFQTNFTKHLITGIVEWLTGAMGGTGITIPEKFDLKGVMSMGLQILGLTWERIREKIAKRVGEPVLAAAEKGMDLILKIKEKGFIVLWDMLVEKAQELKNKVLESISGWAVVQIVKAAVSKLLMMLNPAGAILQIALTIYDGVMWFIENMQRIMEFIMSIFNSIAEIALGQLGKAAGFIEKALAKIIPIILSFLARWLKLSGIGKAIKTAVKKVRAPIDKVLNKIINFIVGKVKKLFGKGKKKTSKKEADKAKKDPKKAKKIKKGLNDLEKEEKKYLTSKKITFEEAKKAAATVRRKHPVFKSIKVVKGKNTYDYKYRASEATTEKGPLQDNTVSDKKMQEWVNKFDSGAKDDLTKILKKMNTDGQLNETDDHPKVAAKLKKNKHPKMVAMLERPLTKSEHKFGHRTEKQAIKQINDIKREKEDFKKKIPGKAVDWLKARKTPIHKEQGHYAVGNPVGKLKIQLLDGKTTNVANSNKGLKAAFLEVLKKGDTSTTADDVFKQGKAAIIKEIDKAVKEVSTEQPKKPDTTTYDWIAVFPTKGKQIFKQPDQPFSAPKPATFGDVLEENKIGPENVQQLISQSIKKTYQRDADISKETLDQNDDQLKAIGLRIYNALVKLKLFIINPTEIPRLLKAASTSKLIKVNKGKSVSASLYNSLAKKHTNEAQLKYTGEVHHIVPLYLGGSHFIENLIKAQGSRSEKGDLSAGVAKSIHRELHEFVDNQKLMAYFKQFDTEPKSITLESLKDTEIKKMIKDHNLNLLIGTLYENGYIKYKDTQIKISKLKD